MKTKLAQLQAMMAAEDWKGALCLAGSWPDACDAVRKGREGIMRPDFQRQLQRDPDALVAAGIEALKARFAPGRSGAEIRAAKDAVKPAIAKRRAGL